MSWTDPLAERVVTLVVRLLRPVLIDIDARTRAIERITNRLEIWMSEVQDVLNGLFEATNKVAAKQNADIELIQGLNDKLADALAADPQARADLDAALAGMRATTTTLEGLAATPSEPVPATDPIVGDQGDTTAGEPGVDVSGQPVADTGQA